MLKPDSSAEDSVDSNEKNPKLKIDDHVKNSKNKNIFAKGYTPEFSEEIFMIRKIKKTVSWTYVRNHLNGEKNSETFYEKE